MTIQQIERSDPVLTEKNLTLLTVHASSLKGRGNVSVYNTDSTKKDIPVVILLHGVYGNNWVWMHLGGVHRVYEQLRAEQKINDMLLVMPEDGSYYCGSGYLPLTNGLNAENWIVDDLLKSLRNSFDNVTEKSNIYLAGLSMGGYGALRLGAKYPELFAGISAHSSITQLSEMSSFVNEPLSIYQCSDNNESNIMYWMKKNKTQLPPLRFDCGIDDKLYAGNVAFHKQLEMESIKHQFNTYNGGHEWSYWNEHVATSLKMFSDIEKEKFKEIYPYTNIP